LIDAFQSSGEDCGGNRWPCFSCFFPLLVKNPRGLGPLPRLTFYHMTGERRWLTFFAAEAVPSGASPRPGRVGGPVRRFSGDARGALFVPAGPMERGLWLERAGCSYLQASPGLGGGRGDGCRFLGRCETGQTAIAGPTFSQPAASGPSMGSGYPGRARLTTGAGGGIFSARTKKKKTLGRGLNPFGPR